MWYLPPGEDNQAGPNTDSQLDLNTVQDALQSVAQKWYTLGLQLGLSGTTLHAVESETGKELSYLSEMLKLWLEREDPRPSWRALIEALKNNNETELANRLQEQYGEWCHLLVSGGGAHELHMLTQRN